MEITEQRIRMAASLAEELNGSAAGSHTVTLHDDYVDIVRHVAGIRVLCAVSLGIFLQMMEDESVHRLIVKNVLRVLKAGELDAIRRRERKVSQEDPSTEG